jgi:AraC-like DNA-binding protein
MARGVELEKRELRKGSMRSFHLGSGIDLYIADFIPSESIEQRFETTNPVLRFYFHIFGSGYWELHSPYRSTSQNRLIHSDSLSSVLFYPEMEGKMHLPVEQRQFHLSVYITPSLLNTYLGGGLDQFPEDLRAISEGCVDKGFSHAGPLSQMMNLAIQHLLDCPYTGPMKALYMESKAMELIVHKLAQTLSVDKTKDMPRKAGPDEMERIHHARDILCSDLENPPRLFDLAHTVGTNHSQLNVGFRELFGTTVFGYLRQMRLLEARRMLEEEDMNVIEAALSVGYSSVSSFSKAFSEHFGLQPVMCRKKKH